ncbi:MAG: thioredoxin family protein [Gammaproteobacteria bacterium]|nr:thioredoxin family protein [Gammaproteobacteria bacterium]
MTQNEITVPDAELLIATGCAHCPLVLDTLSQLLKEGAIGKLEVSNIVSRPERAESLGVRSVPWIRIDKLIFEGQYSAVELRHWTKMARTLEGQTEYIRQQLIQGHLNKLEQLLHQTPDLLHALIPLLENEDTEMQVRIGIDAILESLSGHESLHRLLPELARLSQIKNPRIRNDVTFYLGLTQHPDARPYLEKRLHDESEEIRTTAKESIELLVI